MSEILLEGEKLMDTYLHIIYIHTHSHTYIHTCMHMLHFQKKVQTEEMMSEILLEGEKLMGALSDEQAMVCIWLYMYVNF